MSINWAFCSVAFYDLKGGPEKGPTISSQVSRHGWLREGLITNNTLSTIFDVGSKLKAYSFPPSGVEKHQTSSRAGQNDEDNADKGV